MDDYYDLALKVHKTMLARVKIGTFPENELRMHFRLFANCYSPGWEERFLFFAREEFEKGYPMKEVNTRKAILGEFFDFPRWLYRTQDIYNKALGV